MDVDSAVEITTGLGGAVAGAGGGAADAGSTAALCALQSPPLAGPSSMARVGMLGSDKDSCNVGPTTAAAGAIASADRGLAFEFGSRSATPVATGSAGSG